MASPIPQIDYTSALSLRAQGLNFPEIAATINCNVESLRAGFYRKGLHKLLAQTRFKVKEKVLANRSEALRSRMASQVEVAVDRLEETPIIHAKELANSPDGEGRASVLNRLADVAAKVYGDWGDIGEKGPRISLGSLTINAGADSDSPVKVIDVSGKSNVA